MDSQNGTKPLSLLEALGAKTHELKIDEHVFPFYELTGEQVGHLIEKMEQAATSGVSVLDYFDKETNKTEHYLREDNWLRMAASSRHFFFHLMAYSLRVTPDEVANSIAPRHYPAILQKAYEVNKDFFGEFAGMVKGIISRMPALAEGLSTINNLRLGQK